MLERAEQDVSKTLEGWLTEGVNHRESDRMLCNLETRQQYASRVRQQLWQLQAKLPRVFYGVDRGLQRDDGWMKHTAQQQAALSQRSGPLFVAGVDRGLQADMRVALPPRSVSYDMSKPEDVKAAIADGTLAQRRG